MARLVCLCLLLCASVLWAQPELEWMQPFDGLAVCVAELPGGGYVVGGDYTGEEVWSGAIARHDAVGGQVWWHVFDEMSGWIRSVALMQDGGYLWSCENGVRLYKTDAAGTLLWTREWELGTTAGDLCPAPDGGFVLAGVNSTVVPPDVVCTARLQKISADGDSLWQRAYGVPEGFGYYNLQTIPADGGYLLIGRGGVGLQSLQGLAMRVDENGDSLWLHLYGSAYRQTFLAGQPLADGGFLLAGMQWSQLGDSSSWLVRIDALGDTVWTRTLPEAKAIGAVVTAWDGRCVVAGIAADSLRLWVAKLDDEGEPLWRLRVPGACGCPICMQMIHTADRGYMITGWPYVAGLVKLGPDTIDYAGADQPPRTTVAEAYRLDAAWPNPFNAQTSIRYSLPVAGELTLAVYDVTGRKVTTLAMGRMPAGEGLAHWNAAGFPSGVYFCRMETASGFNATQKLLLLK